MTGVQTCALPISDKVEKFVPPRKGKSHVLRVLRELLYHEPQSSKTDIAGALEFLNHVTRRRSVVFLVSDFISENYEKDLQNANKRHDVVAVTLTDPREVKIPNVGFIELEDAETGEIFLLDTRDESIRSSFIEQADSKRQQRGKLFKSMNIDSIDIYTDQPYIEPLMRFFRLRAKRFR